jgi:ADP-ribosyl-[dinitrogen reductase] hydrolase
MLMNQNNAIGMFMGLAIGDALGGPLEFTEPNTGSPVRDMIGGGVHDLAIAETTDDTAMAMAIADAYLTYKRFAPGIIAQNFKQWRNRGTFGTRDHCFDIGTTTAEALSASSNKRPYGGSCALMTDGNGGIMRLAPHILFNHNNKTMAIAESVAGGLLTHGTGKCIAYSAALAEELFDGARHGNPTLFDKGIKEESGTVMGCYASAWQSVCATESFEDALIHAVNKGGDADTVGAVTGMIAGRLYGYDAIPQRWLDALVDRSKLLATATMLYNMGDK